MDRNCLVQIQNLPQEVADGAGGVRKRNYEDGPKMDAWATIRPMNSQEVYLAQRLEGFRTHVIEMLWGEKLSQFISMQSRIVWKGRKFFVRSLINENNANKRFVAHVEEAAP